MDAQRHFTSPNLHIARSATVRPSAQSLTLRAGSLPSDIEKAHNRSGRHDCRIRQNLLRLIENPDNLLDANGSEKSAHVYYSNHVGSLVPADPFGDVHASGFSDHSDCERSSCR